MATGGGAVATLRNLLPNREELEKWTTLTGAKEWCGLNSDVMKAVCELLGNRRLDHIMIFASMDPSVIRRAIKEARVKEVELTAIEKTMVGLIYNACRQKYQLELCDVVTEGSVPGTASAGAPTPPSQQGYAINPLLQVKISGSSLNALQKPLTHTMQITRYFSHTQPCQHSRQLAHP